VDDPATRREKVRGALVTLDPTLSEVLPYLLGLLGIQEGPDPLAQMDPQIRRQRTLEAIKRIILRESLEHALVVIFEDLHWIDSETQALSLGHNPWSRGVLSPETTSTSSIGAVTRPEAPHR
jgi:predicted ATPase